MLCAIPRLARRVHRGACGGPYRGPRRVRAADRSRTAGLPHSCISQRQPSTTLGWLKVGGSPFSSGSRKTVLELGAPPGRFATSPGPAGSWPRPTRHLDHLGPVHGVVRGARHWVEAHPARPSSPECVYRTVQPHLPEGRARRVPVRVGGGGPGSLGRVAPDLQRAAAA
jgi:hypothetical protein